MKRLFVIFLFSSFAAVCAKAQTMTAALHLTTYQSLGFSVENTPQGNRVRHILQEARRLGFKTVVFNFRGHMITGTGSEIRFTVPTTEQGKEADLLLKTAAYAKSLGLRVAFRPILLVVGPKGEFPYVENRKKFWWHGIIQPKNPKLWFENYFKFHQRYLELAAKAGAESYSIGAEMNSMTSGLGDRDPSWRFGFPKQWVEMIQKAKAIVGPQTKITYGVNYTDQYVLLNGQRILGGEFEQWRFYLTETFKKPQYVDHQKNMQELWSALDVVGVDYYRALASANEKFSDNFETLATQLESRPQSHASQLDNMLTEIALTIGSEKPVFFQEVGYRSVEKCFLSPSAYESDQGKANPLHQAAAWEAFFRGYWAPRWPWMTGVGFWQVLVDEDTDPATNKGFTPMGKDSVETVLKRYLN